jgi:hypothetical protein
LAGAASLRSHLRSRGRVRGFVAIIAVGCAARTASPPEPTAAALGAFLGTELGATVDPATLSWEPRRNVLVELALGRYVLFLATPEGGGPRDLYRAAVRLTPSGQPLSIARVTNLSDTPEADELGLALADGVATFATAAFGNVVAVTALEVGSGSLERTDVLLAGTVPEATLARSEGTLVVRITGRSEELRYDFARRALAGESAVARVVRGSAAEKPLATAIGDAARRTLGDTLTGKLASLGRFVRDAATRTVEATLRLGRAPEAKSSLPRAHVEDAKRARRPEHVWPPPKIPSRFARSERGEGVFRPLTTRGAEACLYETFVHPDPERPSARARVVAMDMRQLELGFVPGAELPRASAGPPGDGRLPRDPKLVARLVAVFSGGRAQPDERFATGAAGRLLAAPRPSAMSVVVLAQSETLMGPWPFGREVPEAVVAFRQGFDALLNASGAPLARDEPGDGDVRSRSGLCVTPAGHLYYAFGERLDRRSLAATFAQSGCAAAVELGGGGEPSGMALVNAAAPGTPRFTAIDPAMSFDAASTLEGASRDVFTVSLRDTKPHLPESAAWQPAPGAQPLPAWITGIFRTSIALGGLTMELFSFENGRFEWQLRPGRREPGARGEVWAGVLPEGARERALATLELGHTTVTPRLGLALGTTTPITLKDAFATLVLAPTEPPRILAPGETAKLRPDEQAVQLPLLADARGINERARERGALRMRSALGVTRSGRVLIGLLQHDSSDPLVVALRSAGAERVVELDRGSHHPAFVHRAGTENPPGESYESTTLWVLGRPMVPGARAVPSGD